MRVRILAVLWEFFLAGEQRHDEEGVIDWYQLPPPGTTHGAEAATP